MKQRQKVQIRRGIWFALAGGFAGFLNPALFVVTTPLDAALWDIFGWGVVHNIGLGAVFGFAVAYRILEDRDLTEFFSRRKLAVMLLAFEFSWQLAIRTALKVAGSYDAIQDEAIIPGVFGGSVGSLIVGLTWMYFLRSARNISFIILVVAIGAIFGALLHIPYVRFADSGWALVVLFVPWQAAIGFILGYYAESPLIKPV